MVAVAGYRIMIAWDWAPKDMVQGLLLALVTCPEQACANGCCGAKQVQEGNRACMACQQGLMGSRGLTQATHCT
jgi:hypothetical protein